MIDIKLALYAHGLTFKLGEKSDYRGSEPGIVVITNHKDESGEITQTTATLDMREAAQLMEFLKLAMELGERGD